MLCLIFKPMKLSIYIYVVALQEGRSVLTMAAHCGHKSLLEFLLDHGVDAFQKDAVSWVRVVSWISVVTTR